MKSTLPTGALALTLALAGAATASAQSREGLRTDRERTLAPTEAPPAPEAAPDAPSIAPFVLRAASVDGSRLPPARLQAAIQPFIGQTLDAQGLARLRAALSAVYADSPYALPLIAIDTREAASGVLRITATEARINRVGITGQTEGDIDLLRHYAASLADEAPLSRRTAERYLSLIADIPGARTTVTTRPAGPGQIDMGLALERTRWEFGLGLDNRGSSTLGRNQVTLSAALNGAFMLGDQTRLTLTVPTDIERYQQASLSHSRPIGWDGAVVTASLSHLRTRTGLDGQATGGGLAISWPAIRGYRTNLVVSAGIDALDSDQAVFGNQVASERTRVVRLSAGWSRIGARSVLSAGGSVSQGIDGLGAGVDDPTLTDLDFTKLAVNASATRAIGQRARISLTVAGQITRDALPTSEQFALGGAAFGRAYGASLLVGDTGWGAHAEAAWRPPGLPSFLNGSELYVFGDGGMVEYNDRPGFEGLSENLSSAGLGARLALGSRTVLEVEGAYALDDPRPGDPDDWRLGLGLTTRF